MGSAVSRPFIPASISVGGRTGFSRASSNSDAPRLVSLTYQIGLLDHTLGHDKMRWGDADLQV